MHFRTPFRIIVSGPSSSGKTEFIKRVLLDRDYLITGDKIEHIVWCCKDSKYVPPELSSKTIENFSIFEGMPDVENEIKPHTLLILDDLMTRKFTQEVCELFTINSHHRAISIFFVTQNFFHQGTLCRDVSLSASGLVYFKNPRDKSQISALARQVAPENFRNLIEVYKDITKQPFSYLMIDFDQRTNDLFRFKTNIFNRGYFECFALNEDEVEKNAKKVAESEDTAIFVADLFAS